MARPGVESALVGSIPPRGIPTNTGTAFVVGLTERGPVGEAIHATSPWRAQLVFGGRVAYGYVFDTLDVAARDELGEFYVSRIVGPDAVAATADLFDAAGSTPGDVALVVTAAGPGAWYDGISVEIDPDDGSGTEFQVIITHDVDGTLETSPLLADRAAAVEWAATNSYIRLAEGPSNADPRAQTVTLEGGDDDRAGITNDEIAAALDAFHRHLGPGQVAAPGFTTTEVHELLYEHAEERNRVAIPDAPDIGAGETVADYVDALTDPSTGAGLALRDHASARFGGQPFAPWVTVPGVARGTTRTVPPSAIVLGLIARSDRGGSANVAVAGENGQSQVGLGLTASFTETQGETLNSNGVNYLRDRRGVVEIYGFRTAVDPDGQLSDYVQLSAMRLLMQIRALGEEIAERYVFAQIDGKGLKIGQFEGDLIGMVDRFYPHSIYGATVDEARRVETGQDVNPVEQLRDGILAAVISVRPSPFAELVQVSIIKRPITEPV
jgi:hypothetical protein